MRRYQLAVLCTITIHQQAPHFPRPKGKKALAMSITSPPTLVYIKDLLVPLTGC